MIVLGIVAGACLCALAVWDLGRRALQSQVRQAELRLESLRRVEAGELRAEMKTVTDQMAALSREFASLDTSLALRRDRR